MDMRAEYSLLSEPAFAPAVSLKSVYYVEADKSYSVHHHPYKTDTAVLLYVTRGQGRLAHLGLTVKAGDLLLFSPKGDFHYYCLEDDWFFWWVEFTPVPIRLAYNIPYPHGLAEGDLPLLRQCLYRLKNGNPQAASALFSCLLCACQDTISGKSAKRGSDALFSQADLYLRAHIDTATVQAVANHLHVSERTLRNIFQAESQFSPARYIAAVRMEEAGRLLAQQHFGISQIAEILGFSNPAYFSNAFKKHYGMSPRRYQQRLLYAVQ